MADNAARKTDADQCSSDLSHVHDDDHDLAQRIVSGVRGYGVTIQRGHSAVAAIASHRVKHSKASDEAAIAFKSALEMIAGGHGCPGALAKDVLERHSL